LKKVAARIASSLRNLDIPCRYGGEEFALILPGLTATEAYAAAERVRKLIETIPAEVLGGPSKITVSAGVCSTHIINDRASVTENELIEWADIALYEAKRQGRNRVERAERPADSQAEVQRG